MMQTLSTTIEAKDEYTRGHSHRVAEYAVLIAEELGWDKKEIRNLRNAAHLYDIGRIGIPDSILNKPTRLTEEEYAVIKEHTIIGAEILKNITLIDHVKEVARSIMKDMTERDIRMALKEKKSRCMPESLR